MKKVSIILPVYNGERYLNCTPCQGQFEFVGHPIIGRSKNEGYLRIRHTNNAVPA